MATGHDKKIAIIAGDGIGPEVTAQAVRLLEWYRSARGLPLELWHLDLGAERYLRDGTTLPPELCDRIARECSAVLLGALGDARVPDGRHAHDILLGLRFGLDLYANIRPVRALCDRLVPLKNKTRKHVDFVVFRENTEGLYAQIGGQLRRGTEHEVAIAADINTRMGVERILRAAFGFARRTGARTLHMADKSNAVRQAHELWLRVLSDVAREFPEVRAQHIYADALCLRLVQAPEEFSVIVTNNLFGDLITDLGAALQGGMGMAASLSKHESDPERVVLCEPVHGSAPDLCGKGSANPCAALLSAALLLGEIGFPEAQTEIERAVAAAVEARQCTVDVGGSLDTEQAASAVLHRLAR